MGSYIYKQINDTDWLIEVNNLNKNICFVLSSNSEIGLPEHIKMINDFNNDISKLESFISLLKNNSSTAFLIYNNL